MSAEGGRFCRVSAVAFAAALAQHVPVMAQSGSPSALAVASAAAPRGDTAGSDAAPIPEGRTAVPFAGTYRLTVALGADTADLILRIEPMGKEESIAQPVPLKRGPARAAPVHALIVPASLSTDSLTVPAVGADSSVALTGTIIASLADTVSPGRWSVTVLAGDDTTSDTPAARLSRWLRRVQADRSALAARCRSDARRENRAAKRSDDPVPCDEATALPLSRNGDWADGALVLLPDGGARVEQRTQTEAGELTLWGSRVPR